MEGTNSIELNDSTRKVSNHHESPARPLAVSAPWSQTLQGSNHRQEETGQTQDQGAKTYSCHILGRLDLMIAVATRYQGWFVATCSNDHC